MPTAGWRRRAVLWHVCAPLALKRRIHPDNKRRDVCATRGLKSRPGAPAATRAFSWYIQAHVVESTEVQIPAARSRRTVQRLGLRLYSGEGPGSRRTGEKRICRQGVYVQPR